jgi:hypothetical protein
MANRTSIRLTASALARQSRWESRDNQDGHFGGRGDGMIVALHSAAIGALLSRARSKNLRLPCPARGLDDPACFATGVVELAEPAVTLCST